MKRLLAGLITIFLTVCGIIGCAPPPEEGFAGNDDFTNVVYSNDGKGITLYLEGAVPRAEASRALSRDLAQFGHDYYEVVFANEDNTIVTRTSWERGQSAAIRGVPRGVEYSTGSITPGQYNAVLFVGKKSDKTLLAVGTIIAFTDDEGNSTDITAGSGATLTEHTVSVTFGLKALEASAHKPELPIVEKSFTSSNANPSIVGTQTSNPKQLPAYDIPVSSTVEILYSLDSGVLGIQPYLDGIIVAAAPEADLIPPCTIKGGSVFEFSPAAADTNVSASFNGSLTISDSIGDSYKNDLKITITTGINIGFGGLVFKVPVVALTSDPSTVDGTAAINWYIRHGYGSNILDLDEGIGNAGGALLLRIVDP